MKCLDECPQLIVTTADIMTEFLHHRSSGLSRCSIAVVDNVDVFAEMGAEFQLRTIVNYMRGGGDKQVLLFGGAWNRRIEAFAKEALNSDFVRVLVGNYGEQSVNSSHNRKLIYQQTLYHCR